jgi:hypothetical protein
MVELAFRGGRRVPRAASYDSVASRPALGASMAVALDHIILAVADARASIRFYYETLGFRYEDFALVRVSPTTVLQLIQRPPETSQHLAFSMSRVEFVETLERLK